MTQTSLLERQEQPLGSNLPAPTAEPPATVLQAIVQMAKDPDLDVAKFSALIEMQQRAETRQAEIEFSRALAALAAKMPRVKKNGRVELIDKQGVSRGTYAFAKWEDIDKVIRPLMTEEGFTLSFDSQPRSADGGGLIVTGTLLHRDGHSRSASMPLALDTGPGRNNLQAMGSTLSYGKRYVAEMLLNIVREGEDDDGFAGGSEPISAEETAELNRGLTETKSSLDAFLGFMGVAALPDIQRRDLTKARNAIEQKRRKATGQ